MAVSNTIGSNVFDILVGLGVPWALQTTCVSYGSEVRERKAPASPRPLANGDADSLVSVPSLAGGDQQPRAGVLGGAAAGIRGPHGER